MSFQITVQPSGHVFKAEPDETILDAALREGVVLPYGCRNGACGSCKGRLLDGAVTYIRDYQQSALSEAEKQIGMALFCSARPQSDLVIESREISAVRDIPIKKLPCRVQKLELLAHDVMAIYLKLPAAERLLFLAGQYIDILKDGKRRSFSMANAPHDDEFLQLHVRNIIGGAFTEYAFNKMKVRDILRFEGPYGTFFLRENSDKPIVLVASGTGFAPIKAIVEHAFHVGATRPMIMYWGARTRADLYSPELPAQWQAQHASFRYVPVLSEPLPADNWRGRTGLVHQAVLDDFSDLSAHQVYACGAPVMVEAAHRDFTALRGLPDDEFFSDAFTFAAPPQPVTT